MIEQNETTEETPVVVIVPEAEPSIQTTEDLTLQALQQIVLLHNNLLEQNRELLEALRPVQRPEPVAEPVAQLSVPEVVQEAQEAEEELQPLKAEPPLMPETPENRKGKRKPRAGWRRLL